MGMNIIIVVMGIIALGAGGWCLWFENHGSDSVEDHTEEHTEVHTGEK